MDTMAAGVTELINHNIPTLGKVFERMASMRTPPPLPPLTNCSRKSEIGNQ
jgi:hypothetical protein